MAFRMTPIRNSVTITHQCRGVENDGPLVIARYGRNVWTFRIIRCEQTITYYDNGRPPRVTATVVGHRVFVSTGRETDSVYPVGKIYETLEGGNGSKP